MQKNTTRSHYLPITYLKHFLQENELYMYKKGMKFFHDPTNSPGNRILKVIGEEGVENVGVQNHLYNPAVPGITSNDIEEIFQKYGENSYNNTVEQIENLQIGDSIPEEIKSRLCLFLAGMRVRTPLFKFEIEQMEEMFTKHFMSAKIQCLTSEQIIKDFKEKNNKDITPEMAESIKKTFINKNYKLEYPNGVFIKWALILMEDHANIFNNMTLTIVKSNRRNFITSDHPLTYFVPQEHQNVYNSPRSLMSRYCEVFFPITKNIAVHLCRRNESEKVKKATHDIVDLFNYNIAHNSYDYIFSPQIMKSLEIFTVEHIPYPYKLEIK